MMRSANANLRAISMLRGAAEDFVIGGYRNRIGYSEIETSGCPDFQAVTGSLISAEAVAIAFAGFVTALKQCAACPLSAFPAGEEQLCRDELLVLALVSALQHGDEETAVLAASTLTCTSRVHETISAAGTYALLLKVSGALLIPVSASAIRALTDPLPTLHPAGRH